jgi:hypothetical protein
MSGNDVGWDYLFVSDLHLSLGYDPERMAYHAREDFFFDDAFLRFLRWADGECAQGRRWELVLVGDTLDFLPVDASVVERYFVELDRRRGQFDVTDPAQVVQYWRSQFGAPPEGQAPERIQRLLFEDDVLRGRVRLGPLAPDAPAALAAERTRVPEWAVEVYSYHDPEAVETGAPLDLRPPEEGTASAFLVTDEAPSGRPSPVSAAARDEAFERRYGFLPAPEKSVDKLQSIYRGHPLFFRALAWFVARGHRLVVLRGNHDLELYWPQVQARIREILSCEARVALGLDEGAPPPPGFQERVEFRPGWFYYRKGVFYAEHGKQYELLDSVPNPIRPVMPGQEVALNPPVGSLGVICLHTHLEDAFPEWENWGEHPVVLLDLLRRYPFRMLSTLVRHGLDFLRMAQRLWLAGRKKDQRPTEEDLADYAHGSDLEPEVVKAIYNELDPPMLVRRPLAWFLFSPGGHVVKILLLALLAVLLVGGGLLWYLVVAPALAALIPTGFLFATVGPALQLLAKFALWLVPPLVYALVRRVLERQYPERFLYHAARRVHSHLGKVDRELRFYVLGHDHRADVGLVERRPAGGHVYYLNTGSWTPWFAEGKRRLQTLGREVEFTFARITRREQGYEADLLRWNDDARRADPQVVPQVQPED